MKNPFTKKPGNALKESMLSQIDSLPDHVKAGAWQLIKAGALFEIRMRFDKDNRTDTAVWLVNGDQSIELAPFRESKVDHE